MTREDVFDAAAGNAARDAAIAQVEDHADDEWLDAAWHVVLQLARARARFSADDVWRALGEAGVAPPREPRALGPVMLRAQRQGVITPTGEFHRSVRVVNHRSWLQIWASQVCRP